MRQLGAQSLRALCEIDLDILGIECANRAVILSPLPAGRRVLMDWVVARLDSFTLWTSVMFMVVYSR